MNFDAVCSRTILDNVLWTRAKQSLTCFDSEILPPDVRNVALIEISKSRCYHRWVVVSRALPLVLLFLQPVFDYTRVGSNTDKFHTLTSSFSVVI